MTAIAPTESRVLPGLPIPDAVHYPDTGFRRDTYGVRLFEAHGYDTGGQPFYSAETVRALLAQLPPAAPQVPERWRDAVADEYLDAIEKAGDILGQADDGETLHEACARVVAERDALLEMNAAQAATIARIQSDGLHVATLHRHPARGELRVEYADDVTELPDGDYKILAYKATDIRGDTCHFGVESTARAWAKSGSVEAVHVRQLRALATPPAPEQPKPKWFEPSVRAPNEPNPNEQVINDARDALGPDHPLYWALDHAATELAVLWARDLRRAEQPKPAGDVEALIHLARKIVRCASPATESGLTCFVPKYQIEELDAIAGRLAAQPAQGEVGA